MTNVKKIEYKKAYVELYEIIKRLSNTERNKIPKIFVENLKEQMDKDYIFIMDDNKELLQQNYKVETKALLVELYEKYLASNNEKNLWENYDRICHTMIEDKKKKDYNIDNIFKNKESEMNNNEIKNDNLPAKIKRKTFFMKIISFFEKFLKRK